MAGHRKHKHEEHPEHIDERWLVTYADLMTLLVALFMVLWSISSVNTSKYESLQRSLAEAFSGKVVPGGHGILQQGGSNNMVNPAVNPPASSLQPYEGGASQKKGKKAAQAEEKALNALKKRVDAIAKSQGLSGKVHTKVTKDGLFIRVLTDDLLFDSGSAVLKRAALPLLSRVGNVLDSEGQHPILVTGNTDNVPVSGVYPSNWELSTARASSVVRELQSTGVYPGRLTAQGRAAQDPVASNGSSFGRTLNRRVEILLPRLATP